MTHNKANIPTKEDLKRQLERMQQEDYDNRSKLFAEGVKELSERLHCELVPLLAMKVDGVKDPILKNGHKVSDDIHLSPYLHLLVRDVPDTPLNKLPEKEKDIDKTVVAVQNDDNHQAVMESVSEDATSGDTE